MKRIFIQGEDGATREVKNNYILIALIEEENDRVKAEAIVNGGMDELFMFKKYINYALKQEVQKFGLKGAFELGKMEEEFVGIEEIYNSEEIIRKEGEM